MRAHSKNRRSAMATFEVVLTAGVCIPAAAAVYLVLEMVVNHYFFMLGNAIGCPFM